MSNTKPVDRNPSTGTIWEPPVPNSSAVVISPSFLQNRIGFVAKAYGVIASVPLMDTARLRLRGHRVEDFGDCAAMWADPAVTHHIGGRPFTAEEVWAKILRYAGLWSLLGFGYWAIVEKVSAGFVGEVGFADFKREIEPSFAGAPEIGWALAPWARGAGFATEAVGAAVAWGDGHFGARQTVCMIDPGNVASIRVAEKCGYREFARTTYKDQPTILFRRWGILQNSG